MGEPGSVIDVPLLRAEARPIAREQLDGDQSVAYDRLTKCLGDAVAELRSAVADDRHSRTFFINGGRGTGKTTVALTLRRDTEDRPAERARQAELGRSLIWLDMLDLEPLPYDANVFNAILVRIEKTLGVEPADPRHASRTLLGAGEEYRTLLHELRRLADDIAVGWHGNLGQRQGHLDPNTYAVEVQRAERARIDLPQRCSDLLAKVARMVNRGDPALFVLIVDDADLNPVACRDLLRVLRALRSPHLFVLVLADQRSVERILHLHLMSEFSRLASPYVEFAGRAPESLVLEQAEDLFRKYFPLAQRAQLAALTPQELVSFRPIEPNGKEASLGALISCADPDIGVEFSGPGLVSDEREPRSAARALRRKLREASDLWYELQSSSDSDSARAILNRTGWFEKAAGDPPTVKVVLGGIALEFSVGDEPADRLKFVTGELRIEQTAPDGRWLLGSARAPRTIEMSGFLWSTNPNGGLSGRILVDRLENVEKIVNYWNSELVGLESNSEAAAGKVLDAFVVIAVFAISWWIDAPLAPRCPEPADMLRLVENDASRRHEQAGEILASLRVMATNRTLASVSPNLRALSNAKWRGARPTAQRTGSSPQRSRPS